MKPSLSLVLLIAALGGCGDPSRIGEEDVADLLANDPAPARPEAAAVVGPDEFDFGPVLARGQTLRHEFTLTNPTDRPVRLSRIEVGTPCCSAVDGPMPAEVPPRGEARIPIVFRPGYQGGPKRIEFAVATDSPRSPVVRLSARAVLRPEVEVKFVDGDDASILAGEPGERRFRVVCRRVADEGRTAPDRIGSAGPISARFVGDVAETKLADGLVETRREVAVTMLPSGDPGPRRGEFRLGWDGGGEHPHTVAWRVEPS